MKKRIISGRNSGKGGGKSAAAAAAAARKATDRRLDLNRAGLYDDKEAPEAPQVEV